MFFYNTGWIYDVTIILYALSLLGYFIDYLQHNRKVNRTAFWLLLLVWLLQSCFLVLKTLELGRLPILTISEGLYFYAWVIVTLSLIVNRLFRIDFFIFFTNILGFIIMTLHLFAPVQYRSSALAEQLLSELLVIHITIAIVSYGAFSLSFIFSIMYLFQFKLLKRKKWGKQLQRFGDLTKLDRMSYRLNMVGVPLLFISLILGTVWAYIQVDNFHWYDAKVIGSFLVIVIYSVYLYLRIGKNIQGKTINTWNIGAFLILIINYFLSSSISKFHIWYV